MSNHELVYLVGALVASFFLGALASWIPSVITGRRRQPVRASSDGSMSRLPLPPKLPAFAEVTHRPVAPVHPPDDDDDDPPDTSHVLN